jgi:hypothetical protein
MPHYRQRVQVVTLYSPDIPDSVLPMLKEIEPCFQPGWKPSWLKRRKAQLVKRWSGHVIRKERQDELAHDFPAIGERLEKIYQVVRRLTGEHADALANGLLGGLTAKSLFDMRYRLIEQLVATADTRTLLVQAGRRRHLVPLARDVRRSVAEFDAQLDLRITQLQELCKLADLQHADEVTARLAAKLDIALLTSPFELGFDLDSAVAGAQASTEVIHNDGA